MTLNQFFAKKSIYSSQVKTKLISGNGVDKITISLPSARLSR